MTKKYSYAYTKSLYDHQYPDEKLISIHERPLADPTGKLTAIIDYEKPLSRHDMDKYDLEEFPFWLAQEHYLPLFSEECPLKLETLEEIRDEVAHAISVLADYHPLGDAPHGIHVGGIVDKDVKKLDLYRVYDTIPSWGINMVEELITGTDPTEFTFWYTTSDIKRQADKLHNEGSAILFVDASNK